ncbi:MAG: hypothetical protein ACHRHE_15615 [Tepidisphaerales bacterium]
MNPDTPSGGFDRTRVAALMQQLATLTDPTERDQVLDELQELVGLAGKMVLDRDITQRAKKLLAQP